ncbi:MAG: heparan-alpha-glucosaminide N-acetyltransferase domain-containing protein [Bacteroidia bacterium]
MNIPFFHIFDLPMNQSLPQSSTRILSIDLLRGLVMVLMALDHVRDFFHSEAFVDDPLNLATTTPALYFTRWITHFCAPVFVFLSGISAFLSGTRKTKNDQSLFLIKRGLWLILVEFTLVTFGWTFNPFFNIFVMQVIWAIGVSMIALGIMVHLPLKAIGVISILLITGHNVLDYAEAEIHGQAGFLWDALHRGHFTLYPFWRNHAFLIVYPLIPWMGIMGLGYCFGTMYTSAFDTTKRIKILLATGLGLLLGFVILRWFNNYGDPHPWTEQASSGLTFLSFLDVTKYPPSLAFSSIMLGPALLFLAFTESWNNRYIKPLLIFGKVPFFYYIVHIYLIHVLCVAVFFFTGHSVSEIASGETPFLFRPREFGYSLLIVYFIWIAVVAGLYYPCKKYLEYKLKHKTGWSSYL